MAKKSNYTSKNRIKIFVKSIDTAKKNMEEEKRKKNK